MNARFLTFLAANTLTVLVVFGCLAGPGNDVPPKSTGGTCTGKALQCPAWNSTQGCVGAWVEQDVVVDGAGTCIHAANELDCGRLICQKYCGSKPNCQRSNCKPKFVAQQSCPENVSGVPDSPYAIQGFEYNNAGTVTRSYEYPVPSELGVPVGLSAMESLFVLSNAPSDLGNVQKLTAIQFELVDGVVTPTKGPTTDLPGAGSASALFTTWFSGGAGSDTSVDALVGSPNLLTRYNVTGTLNTILTRTVSVAGTVVQMSPAPNAYQPSEMYVLTSGQSWLYDVDVLNDFALGEAQLDGGAVGQTIGADSAWVVTSSKNQVLKYPVPLPQDASPLAVADLAGSPVGIGGADAFAADETVMVTRTSSTGGGAVDTFFQGNIESVSVTHPFAGTPVAMKALTSLDRHWVWVVTTNPAKLYLFDADQAGVALVDHTLVDAVRPIALYVTGSVAPIPNALSEGSGKNDRVGCPFAPKDCSISETGFVHVLTSRN